MLDMDDEQKLPVKVKLGFGIGDLGGNLYFTVIAFWLLNYFTDTVGIAAGMAGIAVAIGKIWDAVTDPLMGYISDRTKSRWGRRRPYLLFGSFVWFIAMIILFTNPGLSNSTALFIWAVAAFCFLSTAFTVVNVPYSSLTPELTKDYHERSSLNGYRAVFMVVGTLIGAGAALPLVNALPNKNIGFSVMGAFFGALMMGAALITFSSVREPKLALASQPKTDFLKSYLNVFKTKPFLIILFTYMLNLIAVSVVSGSMIYYFKYIHDNEGLTTVALLILLVTAMIFIPLAVLISKKIGKKTTYAVGMLIIALACILVFALGHELGIVFVFVMMFVAGVGLSTTYPMPWSMIPDTVEYGYLQSGERQEGGYYGIWTFFSKAGQGLAVLFSGLVLQGTGYVAEAVQTDLAQLGIRLLIGPVTALFFAGAAFLLLFYPLNEKRYQELQEKIKVMEKQRGIQSTQ
jgi:GPH family glycoside/pentoside/hexuronide:cation symporter